MRPSSSFIISLDFELFWGLRDTVPFNNYKDNIKGVYTAIPAILELFQKYNISCTWACVGALLCDDLDELKHRITDSIPYHETKLDLKKYIGENLSVIKNNSYAFFAPELVKLIKSNSNQEIASHTFSHYYCLEPGQSLKDFEIDLISCKNIIKEKTSEQPVSIVFPRNQHNLLYNPICNKHGITVYRGNPSHWAHKASSHKEYFSIWKRAYRLSDTYFKFSNSDSNPCFSENDLVNVPASRFLQPYTPLFKRFEAQKISRIKKEMEHAARNNSTYHLWWHPHNFGQHTSKNLQMLEGILEEYQKLSAKHGMRSQTMKEVGNEFRHAN